MFTLRSFSGSNAQERLNLLRQLRHNNILTTYNLFTHNDEIYAISEDTEVSLEELIIAQLDESQLAAIIAQVIKNATLQQKTELTKDSCISCSNVVLTKKEVAKINTLANVDNCSRSNPNNKRSNVQALRTLSKYSIYSLKIQEPKHLFS
ncbi:hypothetical protein K505DRAFT_343835 [Melanomma pulvis-pyrius CBS 109.77]|uniref:Protein kinase domain-containing protein n=1 Tax=Melanomma pulvis-pyrius CBS 109.77 TaxID=1314802 RepID=A0A6A6WR71_9PLEO|nr:hypothetical protein K505DRAFT_343835 [Melanomma pulvis-pyrius CBS 109.77]